MDAHPSAAVTRGPEEAEGALTPTPVSGPCARSAARRILRCFPGSCFNPACLPGALRAHECTARLQAGLPAWHPQAKQVWPRQKAGLQGVGGPALEAILASMGTNRAPTRSTCPRRPVPLGNWRLWCSLGLVVPASLRPCSARLCRLGCPDGRAGPKGGCEEAKWGSDLASRPWAGVQLTGLARPAHCGVAASAPVGQRQTPLRRGWRTEHSHPGSKDTRSPEVSEGAGEGWPPTSLPQTLP